MVHNVRNNVTEEAILSTKSITNSLADPAAEHNIPIDSPVRRKLAASKENTRGVLVFCGTPDSDSRTYCVT